MADALTLVLLISMILAPFGLLAALTRLMQPPLLVMAYRWLEERSARKARTEAPLPAV